MMSMRVFETKEAAVDWVIETGVYRMGKFRIQQAPSGFWRVRVGKTVYKAWLAQCRAAGINDPSASDSWRGVMSGPADG